MARIFKDSSVLNQFGSPSLNSNTLANRPAFGQVGRLFVDTTNNVIYRDTGSSWVLVGGAGSTPNLQAVTTVGNTTTVGIFAGATGNLTSGFLFEVLGRTKLTATSGNAVYIGLPNITPNAATFDVFGYSSFRLFTDAASNIGSIMRNDFLININANITTGDPSGSINQLTLNCNTIASLGNATPGQMYIGAGLNKNIIDDDGSAVSTVTMVQNSGGIFALSPLQSISEYDGTGSTTFTHYAGLVINGIKATNGNAINITNYYQLLINSSQQFSGSTTVTNRWGIYQNGANDYNYFQGNVLINTLSPVLTSDKLSVNGVARITQVVSTGDTIVQANLYSYRHITVGDVYGGILYLKCITSTPAITITNSPLGTGSHTTSGNHLPININGITYWIALLNPPT
jgi:hypothetical protein